jgi:hypothetical protein
MSPISTVDVADWADARPSGLAIDPTAALEAGAVLHLPNLGFQTTRRELQAFSPGIAGSSKNVSFDPVRERLGGTVLAGDDLESLRGMMARFSSAAAKLVDNLMPSYRGHLQPGRASFRPVEIEGRKSSWRKDDTRLHVDSFPSAPVQGRRILRVFTNVNPAGRPRQWRIGEEGFESVANRFAPRLQLPTPGVAVLLRLLRITKTRRSPYDALMLRLHDLMKQDEAFQAGSLQTTIDFAPGSTWVAYSDQVPHAAMSGQFQLEKTFLLPVEAMLDERRSPLRVLERLKGRPLIT